ncbi:MULTISPECIES: ABC transporter ATP-binding protein [Methanobacterium]|jgi:ABC-2 type transport system ATP-binding protein|uniref:Multidrug ABC transporter ATP-binding protein n=1 Tax=Methanobacterium bryantii TaxID=2161 RepID=A0A2A2H4L0_METBR|nr:MULTISPECIES: ATP-binding cassette domain-containing protein [Methanobacterium]OEC87224.1 multidrug ABC transporter ATP-binding protein [Methanobacterium sp. A39]PAV04246.1 multidrug ABC transporter ATP-binding protein [Methanobacterium bryantii]
MDEYVIEAQNLTKKYGDFLAVDNLNLKIKKGEVFGFLGPNGAGKTTSISMMVGLLRPSSGKVLINDKEVEKIDKGTIGICPQELVLWENLTCYESLKLMGDMYEIPKDKLDQRIKTLLKDLFLTDKADTVVSNLSGGMKRRLNLALAVIHQPEIVLLDEPSEGLDPQSRRVLWNYIRSLRDDEGKTVILTTHLMDEADRLSDRVAIIDHGQLLKLDTPKNLKKEVGEGDIVEMTLSNPNNRDVIKYLENLEDIISVAELDGKINLRAFDAVGKLPKIIGALEESNINIDDLAIRQNTLEDVFIELTGTGLRE